MAPLLAANRSRRTWGPTAGPLTAPAVVCFFALVIVLGCGPAAGPSAPSAAAATATRTAPLATATAATPTAAPTTPITYPTGSTDLVVRVADGGGLLPMEMRLTELPTISVYGDGRVITALDSGRAPTDPLVPALVESRLTPEGMAQVLAAAGEAGLLGPDRRLWLEDVYDLWVVAFTLNANGATHRTAAYALGFAEEAKLAPPDEMPARRALGTFFGQMHDLRGWLAMGRLGPEAAYRPARMRVCLAPIIDWPNSASGTPTPATPRPGQDVRDWPLDAPPDLFGTPYDEQGTWRCGVLESAAAEVLGSSTATNDTRWRADGRLYRVVVRPLLPDEVSGPE